MKHKESNLQISCVKWFRLQYPRYERLLWAIPNGGARDAKTGMWLKKEGVIAGASDLVLFVARGEFHTLHIEMKTERGNQTATQVLMELALLDNGHKYVVCKSLTEFIEVIKEYLENN